jgi:hypothetical protein
MDEEIKVTVFLRGSDPVGRVIVEKVRQDGGERLSDHVPIPMLQALCEHWAALGWEVIDTSHETIAFESDAAFRRGGH